MIKWDAEHYNNNSSNQEKWAKELMFKLDLKGNERLLDIGCGDGKVTAEISKLLPNGFVIGIDSSKEMIRFSKENFNYPNVDFKEMDMREINYENEFDLVFSTAALHWVTNHIEVLQQIKKCLRGDGKIFLQMGGKGNQEELVNIVDKAVKREKWLKYFKNFRFQYGYYGKEEYTVWLMKTGFMVKRVELINKDNIQNGKEGLIEWIKLAFSPYVQRIAEEEQVEFINEVAERYIVSNPIDENGFCHIKMVRLEVEAYI